MWTRIIHCVREEAAGFPSFQGEEWLLSGNEQQFNMHCVLDNRNRKIYAAKYICCGFGSECRLGIPKNSSVTQSVIVSVVCRIIC